MQSPMEVLLPVEQSHLGLPQVRLSLQSPVRHLETSAVPLQRIPSRTPPPIRTLAPHPTTPLVVDNTVLPSSLALKAQFSRTDPKYASSFGAIAFERTTRLGLKLVGWRAIGLAGGQWAKLERPLASLIGARRQDWEKQRPRCQQGAAYNGLQIPPYVLRCFLLGPDQHHGTPHVAVVSGCAWFRKAVGSIFMRSGLLASDGFNCFGLPDKPEFYTNTGSDGTAPPSLVGLDEFEVQLLSVGPYFNGIGIEVLLEGKSVSRAAIGGFVHVADGAFGMTVRHAFIPPDSSMSFYTDDEDSEDCEIDIFEHESPDSSDWSGGQAPSTLGSPAATDFGTPAPKFSPVQDSATSDRTPLELASEIISAREPTLDWALSKVGSSVKNELFAEVDPNLDESRIAVKTPFGVTYGDHCSDGILGEPIMGIPQPVLVVSAVGIQLGDCGSWGMRVRDGKFVGMLIGYSPTLHEAYFLPMMDIIHDIRLQTGQTVTIPGFGKDPPTLEVASSVSAAWPNAKPKILESNEPGFKGSSASQTWHGATPGKPTPIDPGPKHVDLCLEIKGLIKQYKRENAEGRTFVLVESLTRALEAKYPERLAYNLYSVVQKAHERFSAEPPDIYLDNIPSMLCILYALIDLGHPELLPLFRQCRDHDLPIREEVLDVLLNQEDLEYRFNNGYRDFLARWLYVQPAWCPFVFKLGRQLDVRIRPGYIIPFYAKKPLQPYDFGRESHDTRARLYQVHIPAELVKARGLDDSQLLRYDDHVSAPRFASVSPENIADGVSVGLAGSRLLALRPQRVP